ncbi:unnamed protein product [Gongylonema pulchrum]|uniref:Fibronectin type-III domain-containing protein n=1 Tax=Gongylonema pulchrum TaxID=637853 RepID=A0A183EFE9_9BILA|nr:unnamed protein product [Gongylonema pulchrum]
MNDGLGDCDPCPAHSTAQNTGSAICQCDAGYYRAEDETADYACTQPPSKPSRVTISRLDETSVLIEWEEPLMLGGRKELWYRYQCSECPTTTHARPSGDTFTELWYRYQCSECPVTTHARPSGDTFTVRRLELSGLKAGVTYTVLIFAENKVSKMVSTLGQYGVAEFTTRPLVPLIISGLRIEGVQENGVTIAWKPPSGALADSSREISYEVNRLILAEVPLVPLIVSGLRIEGVQENGVTIAWKPPSGALADSSREISYEIESSYNDTSTVVDTAHTYYTFESLKPLLMYTFKVRVIHDYRRGMWSDPLIYQPNRALSGNSMSGDAFTYNNSIADLHWSSPGPPLWVWILLVCAFLAIVLFIFLVCSRQNRSRKRMSDCDGLDSYKNGTFLIQ